MPTLFKLLEKNREWAEATARNDPDYFPTLASQQHPEYLWIGCSDSRVPANQITDLMPGEVFVHRNIANMVVHTDLNQLSVLQYAVQVLKVKHVIVCGHYGCGGVKAALEPQSHGLIDNWLRHIQDVESIHFDDLQTLKGEARVDRLCELNVIAQARNLSRTPIMREAWKSGQFIEVHSWIYGLKDGRLRPLQDVIRAPMPRQHSICVPCATSTQPTGKEEEKKADGKNED